MTVPAPTEPSTAAPGAALLDRMLHGVFNEPDPRRRDAVIAEVFTDDVVFSDDGGSVTGRADLAAAVTGLLAQGPGLVFTPSGPFRGVGDLGMRSWRLAPPDGAPVLGGLDVALVVDGQISRLWTVLEG